MATIGSTPEATTVYGTPAYADRVAAVDEVHARPHPLLQPPRGLLQFAFMTEGNPAADRAAMRALSDRFGVAANLYRFGASRASFQIVEERLAALSEVAVAGYCTWQDFLQRRIAPAMRTCQSVKERQAKLSDNLSRTISLLRSWIDIELQRQDRDLLASMNTRARLRLRLQQTVEGLSVAAISYYVVGLLAYLLKGIAGVHDMVAPELAMAVLVPVVLFAIWWTVRRLRRAHGGTDATAQGSDD